MAHSGSVRDLLIPLLLAGALVLLSSAVVEAATSQIRPPGAGAQPAALGQPVSAALPGQATAAPGAPRPTPVPGVATTPQTATAVPGVAAQGVVVKPSTATAVPGVAATVVPTTPGAATAVPGTVIGASPASVATGVPAAQAVATTTPGAVATAVGDTAIGVTSLVVTPAGTKVSSAFNWNVVKRFASGATTEAVSVPVGGQATASYQIVVTKSLTSQQVAVGGTFSVTGSGSFSTPTVTVAPSPAATPSIQVNCQPPFAAPSSCSFSLSWSDSSVSAAAGGTVTVAVGGSTASQPYSFAGTGANTGTGECATVSDSFTAGTLSANNYQVAGSYPPTGMQICDNGDKLFQYTVTFQNMEQTWCTTAIQATNVVTVTPTGSTPVTASATATIAVTGCSGSATATIGDLKTTVINSYTWTLEKTGGGSGLTTTPQEELTIPFTITATQALGTSLGYVAGAASFQNTGGSSMTITGLTVSLGSGQPQSVVLANCQATTVAASSATSCSFNVTATSAPAAGTVSAVFTYTASGSTTSSTATSTAVSYSFTTADTYNLGGTANLYDTIDTSSLTTTVASATGQPTATQSVARLSPADAAPPTAAPGVTLSGSKTFTYNVIISKLLTCGPDRTITNTATLTPVGSSQGVLSKAASATFSVTGCNVLPTVSLSNIQTWAAVTWAWTMQKTATPNVYQVAVGGGATANYRVQLTRTYSTGNFWMSGTLSIVNPASYSMYISSVTLMSTTGQVGALPPMCLGGSNVGGSTISTGVNNPYSPYGVNSINPYTGAPAQTPGSFAIAAGAQIQCVFNVSAGTGTATQGEVYAQATTTSSYVGSSGNTAMSQPITLNLIAPTQQWDIGGCVTFSDQAVTQGSAGAWTPTLTGLPQQQKICGTRTYEYGGVVSPVPATGAACNQGLSIVNTATALPDGGTQAQSSQATIQVMAIGCPGVSPPPLPAPVVAPVPSPVPLTSGQLKSSSPLTPAVQADSVKVVAVGDYEWTVAVNSSADGRGTLSVPFGSSRSVLYTVTARRRPAFQFFVSGLIVVTNRNDAPVSATAVVAQLPMGTVPAACPGGRMPVQVPASGSITCLFNASLTEAAAGTVSAVATSSAGSSSSETGVSYSMDVTPKGAAGGCAVVVDALASRPQLPAGSFAVRDNRPAGTQAPPVCADTSYNFTAAIGPFADTACASYVVTAAASATPTDGAQTPVTGQNTLQLRVDGCPATAQSVSSNRVVVVASPAVGRSVPAYQWAATAETASSGSVPYQDESTVTFNVTWTRVDATTSRMAGSLLVSNPTTAPITIKAASVLPELGDAAGSTAAGASSVIDAKCASTTLPAGGSTNCSWTGTVSGRPTSFVGQVVLSDGHTADSAPVQLKLASSSSRGSQTGSAGCADIITGLFLSPALLASDAGSKSGGNTADQFKACGSGGKAVSVKLGPFKEDQCGAYVVTLTTRVRPSAASGQQPFSSVGVAKVDVRGCPLSETPQPEVIIGDGDLNVTNVVRYPWTIKKSSDNADPLVLRYNQPQDVTVTVDVNRSPGQRSVGLAGYVAVMARGTKPVTVQKVQVGVLQRLGELTTVDATCPESAKAEGGGWTAPPRPAKLLCRFQVSAALPPMDGAVTPLVFLSADAGAAPLPATPTIYRVASAPRAPLGECAVIGASRTLKKEGSQYAVEGQPTQAAGSGLPASAVCGDVQAAYTLTFGPFADDACGRYVFTSDLSAKPYNTSQAVKSPLNFDVDVRGCSS